MAASRSRFTPALLIAIAAVELSSQAQSSNVLQITNLAASSNGWRITWTQSNTGAAYTVQFQDTPKDIIWRLPESQTPFPTQTNQWVDPSTTNQSRFYRVVGV